MRFSIAGNDKFVINENGIVDVKGGQISLTKQGSSNFLKVGLNQNANNYAYIDFIGDDTYTGYGLRLIRNNTGANSNSLLVHRGTGTLNIKTQEAAPITFTTSDTERFRITSTGDVGIGTATANAGLHILHSNSSDAPGILLEDANTSQGAPYLEIIGKRSDANTHQKFLLDKFYLAKK